MVKVFKTLDCYEISPPDNLSVKPFFFLDGHGSWVDLQFITYSNNPEDHWVICISVPCGTALWQIGDSKVQDGSFSIGMARRKKEFVQIKERLCLKVII